MTETDETKAGATKPIPEPTLRRLPVYYQYLKKMRAEKGFDYISSTQIGNDLNMLPIKASQGPSDHGGRRQTEAGLRGG